MLFVWGVGEWVGGGGRGEGGRGGCEGLEGRGVKNDAGSGKREGKRGR